MTKPNLRVIKGGSRKPRKGGKRKPQPRVRVVRVLQPGGTQRTSVRLGMDFSDEDE